MFKGRTVLVTGGTSGIGRSCAIEFARRGASVVVLGRSETKAIEVCKEVREVGGRASYFLGNLGDRSEHMSIFKKVREDFGAIDYAVNSAGMEGASYTSLLNYPEPVWSEVINLNVTAVWWSMKEQLAMMKDRPEAAIVNVASVAGLQGSLTGGCAYTASKHALVGLTRSAALEYAKKNIRINAVCPGIVRTPMAVEVLGDELDAAGAVHPMGRLCEPAEVAAVVLWLCGSSSSFVTGAAIPVDGGVMA